MNNLLVKDKNNKFNLGKLYFAYVFFALILQILGLNSKGGLLDTVWKVFVIACTLLFTLKHFGSKVLKSVIAPTCIYVAGQLLALAFLPENIMGKVNIFSSLSNVAVIVAMIYLLLSIPYMNNTFEERDFTLFYKAFIGLMLYAVVFNLIKNWSAVIGFMNNSTVYSNMVSSFFDNKQTFGMFLLMAVMCSIGLYAINNKNSYLILAGLFFINLFICLSRTALIACGIFIVVIMVTMFRKNNKLSLILLTSCILAVVIALVITPLRNFLFNVVFNTDKTISARENTWIAAFNELKGMSLLFGYGEANSSIVLLNAGVSRYSHNGIVQVLLSGGILKLALYICFLIKSISSCIYIKKHNPKVAYIFIAMLISIFAYSMGEAIVLFDTSIPCVVATILVVAIPCCVENMYKNQQK